MWRCVLLYAVAILVFAGVTWFLTHRGLPVGWAVVVALLLLPTGKGGCEGE